MQDRREFFQSLIAGGATVRKNKKRVKGAHRQDIRLYRGPMEIPPHVYEAVREDPSPMRATGRGSHLLSRYAEADGTVWIFRCKIPASRQMVGEIVQVPVGKRIRIHCWSAATLGTYCTPDELIANQRPQEIMPRPIMPPLGTTPQPVWIANDPDYADKI